MEETGRARSRIGEETKRTRAETNRIRAETNRTRAEINRTRAETNRTRGETNRTMEQDTTGSADYWDRSSTSVVVESAPGWIKRNSTTVQRDDKQPEADYGSHRTKDHVGQQATGSKW